MTRYQVIITITIIIIKTQLKTPTWRFLSTLCRHLRQPFSALPSHRTCRVSGDLHHHTRHFQVRTGPSAPAA